ncbi:MAG: URC4/urg3 family protein [SAR324 cluster bacterium]|nr:URC4/urg3 family protein [SAR324 cluster bacterium]
MEKNSLKSYLQSPSAIRERCGQILKIAQNGKLLHFDYHPEHLKSTVDYIVSTILENYPDLEIPYHSRWRHFDAGNFPRMSWIENDLKNADKLERGRILFELVISSVLLDAGAGREWTYHESKTQQPFARSEGLAVASFHMYFSGLFSADTKNHMRADGGAMQDLSSEKLAEGLQASPGNPLEGLAGRAGLIKKLGRAVLSNPEIFTGSRLGGLFDFMIRHANKKKISALFIFDTVLNSFASIWPGRVNLGNTNLGDCWPHPLLRSGEKGSELIPFHKLSQWLSYSLVEPLENYGLTIEDIDQLTGLAEYRNGGLFLDCQLLQLKNPDEAEQSHEAGSPLIVEWRALTIALLDLIAHEIRKALDLDQKRFPLVKILEGGTWSAGRKIARELRDDGSPPITLISDGTVF